MTHSRKRKATAHHAENHAATWTTIAPEIRNRILRYLLIEENENIIAKPLQGRVNPYEPLADRQPQEGDDGEKRQLERQLLAKRRKIEAVARQRGVAPFPTFAPSNMDKYSYLEDAYRAWLAVDPPRRLYKAQQAYGIFVSCKQLYTEATAMFFGTHTFSATTLPDLLAFLNSIGSQIALIRQVRIPDLKDDWDEDTYVWPDTKKDEDCPRLIKTKDGGNGLVLNDIIRRLHSASKIEQVSIPARRFGQPYYWEDDDDAVDWYWQEDTSSHNKVELLPFLELQ